MLVLPVDAVGKGHGLVLSALVEPVREDLIQHPALDGRGGGKIRFVHGELPPGAGGPAHHRLAHGAPEELAKVGIQIEIVKIQPGPAQRKRQRKPVHALLAAVEGHGVVHRLAAVPDEHQMGAHESVIVGDGEPEGDLLAGFHRAEGGFIGRVEAVV